jgi:hypothetical protein
MARQQQNLLKRSFCNCRWSIRLTACLGRQFFPVSINASLLCLVALIQCQGMACLMPAFHHNDPNRSIVPGKHVDSDIKGPFCQPALLTAGCGLKIILPGKVPPHRTLSRTAPTVAFSATLFRYTRTVWSCRRAADMATRAPTLACCSMLLRRHRCSVDCVDALPPTIELNPAPCCSVEASDDANRRIHAIGCRF